MTTFLDRVKFTVSGTPGTGAVTPGSAVSTFQTPSGAGAVSGDVLPITFVDGTAWEESYCLWNGTTLTRTLLRSSTGSLLSLTSAAVGGVTLFAQDLPVRSSSLVFVDQQVLGSTAASVTFSNIPQTYEDLVIVVDGGSVLNNSATTAVLGIQFNGDTGNNYTYTMLGTYGAGTGFSNNSGAANSMGLGLNASAGTAGVPFSFNEIEIANYRSSTRKSGICQFSSIQGNVGICQGTASGNWTGTAAITSVTIVDRNGNNFAVGSKFTLYARAKSNGVGSNDPTLYLIHDQTLAATAATYDVTDIPQGYEDLIVMVESRQNTGAVQAFNVRPNNDTGANYTAYIENRFGSATFTDHFRFGCSEAATATASVFAPNEGVIFGYSKTNRYKDFQSHGFYPSQSFEDRCSGVWRSNSAITSLRLYPDANSFDIGTRIRVYGRKPSIALASFGNIYTDKQSLNGLATKTLTVPAGYSTLRLILNGATLQAALQDNPVIRVNGLSTSIYSTQRQYGFGSTNTADQGLSATSWSAQLAGLPGTTAPANSSGFIDLEIFDYANSVFRKTGKFHGRQPFSTGSPDCYNMQGALEVNLTSAITSISVATGSGANFKDGSTVELILLP